MTGNVFDQFDGQNTSGNVFDQFDRGTPKQTSQTPKGLAPLPGYGPPPEDDSRTGDSLRPYFGGRNPVAETYDHFIKPWYEEASPERKAELEKRGITERIADSASFAASVPVRIATQGKYGLGDVLDSDSVRQAEGDFVNANREYLEPIAKFGEATAGIPLLSTMGRVAPAQIPAPSNTASGVAKGNTIGLQSNAQRHVRPSDINAQRRANLRQDFEDSGVTPFGPAFSGKGMQSYAKTAGEQPLVGAPIQNASRNTFAEARTARDRLADVYGGAQTLEDAGRVAERGLDRFQNDRVIPKDVISDMPYRDVARIAQQPDNLSSMKTRADAMYERAWRNIPEDMRQGRTVLDLPAVRGNLTETQDVIRQIARRNLGTVNASRYQQLVEDARARGVDPESAIAKSMQAGQESMLLPVAGNNMLASIIRDVHSGKWRGSLEQMRNVRSEIRRLASRMATSEANTLSNANVLQIQRAVTRDIANMLERNATGYANAGEAKTAIRMRRSAAEFRNADRYYAGAVQRMEQAQKLFDARTAEQLTTRIQAAARGQGKGDLEMLRSLKSMLRPEEFDDVAGAVLRNMGEPTGSAARGITGELGFSVNTFTTRWQNMSPEARRVLFRSSRRPGAYADLNKLVRVMQSLADFEATANTSRTFSNMAATAIVTGGAAGLMTMPVLTFATLLGARGMSKFLTSKAYIRWMTRTAELERLYSRSRSPQIARRLQNHWADLRPLLNDDPLLAADVARAMTIATEPLNDPR